MKTLLLFWIFVVVALTAFSQSTTTMQAEKDVVKRIEVTGTAELEVVPDELYFNISLREYFKDEKNQRDKVGMETLEKQLVEAVKAAGLPKENLSVSGTSGYREWNNKKKPQYFLAGKQFQLKLTNANNINDLLAKVDDRGVEYANMSRAEHSKKEEYRKQVKINALKAAKDKATYLLESIGEKIGEVLVITELEEGNVYPMYKQAQFNLRMASAESADASGGSSELEYQKIKYNYRMQATFRVK